MADKVMAMLYTLVDKFLDGAELDEIKEAMTMTRLGQMIEKDGREKERISLKYAEIKNYFLPIALKIV